MGLIWVARGKTWGYRFLRDGGFADPLPEYDAVFSVIGDRSEAWLRAGRRVALRFPDPLGRADRAGRVISHEFVVFGALADRVHSIDDGLQLVWPLPGVADRFERIWDEPHPPEA